MADKKSATAKRAEGSKSLRKEGPTLGERRSGPIADQREINDAGNEEVVTRVHTPGS